MAVTIANQWTGTAADQDAEIVTSPTAGNMLVAVIGTRVADGSAPTLTVGDVCRNGWTLISDPMRFASSANTGAQLQVEVWACPAVQYAGWPWLYVYAAATQITASDVGSVVLNVIEATGITGDLAVDVVNVGATSGAGSITLTAPTPGGGANCLQIAAAVTDAAFGSVTTTGTGWIALTSTTSTNPAVGLAAAWREAGTGGSVTFAASGTNWAGVIVSLRTSGLVPAQPNPAWPATRLQIGLGYTLATPLSRVRWTDQTSRYLSLDDERGIQAELGTAQQGQGTLVIRNDDGAYTQRTVTAAATATAAGTASTIKVADASATNINVSDFFQIQRTALNSNTGFESGTTGWTGTGGTFTTITVGAGHAAKMTPDGVTATVSVLSSHVTVTAGVQYAAAALIQCDVTRTVNLVVNWYDASDVFLSADTIPVALAAAALAAPASTVTAPAGAAKAAVGATMTGTPAASNIMYLDEVSLRPADSLTVYQVTGRTSAGGTTTVSFARADRGTGAVAPTVAGDVYAGIAIDLYIPWRLLMTVAGTTYTVDSGWLRDLQLAFTDAHWAEVNGALADPLEVLSVAAAPSALRGEIYRRSALHSYWPLDDAAGSGYAANQGGVSNSKLVQTVSKYGRGANTNADFGAATQDIPDATGSGSTTNLLGDPGTGWSQDGQTAAEMATKGYALVGSDPSFPSITNGVTIFGTLATNNVQLTAIAAATADPTLVILRNTDPAAGVGQGSVIKVSISRASPFYGIVTVWDKATHATTATTASLGLGFGGEWGLWALTFNQTSWSFYVRGGLAGSGSCNLVPSFSGIDIGGEADPFWHGRTFPSTHAHIAIFGRRLTAGEISHLADSAAFGYTVTNETIGARIQKKLGAAAWRNPRIIGAGGTPLAPEATPSGSVMDLASQLGGDEDGLVFADAASQLQYRSRLTAYQQTSRATLGDGPGEIPFQPGQLFDFNPTFIYNDIEVENTSEGGYTRLTSSTFVAVDDVSAARYGARTMNRSTRFASDSYAWDIAWWWLARYAYPKMRVGTVEVSAAETTDAARWAFVCGVEVGDLVVVTRRPIGQPAISIRCRVLHVALSFKRTDSDTTAQVTLTLAAAPSQVAIANDTTYGVVGGTVLGA